MNQGAERLGATVFPLGVIESQRQLDLMQRIGSTVFSCTPSYALHLANLAKEMGIDLPGNSVKRLLVGGEPGGALPGTKRRIQRAWGAGVHDCVSTSEMYPFQTTVECEAEQGPHLYIDEVYAEVVSKDDPNTAVPVGTSGAMVYTHLWRESQPMIRFWPGDETEMIDEPCRCGRTYPRLPRGVFGRLDDMLIIRGANVYPSAIETVLRELPELGPEFEIVVDRKAALDEMLVRVQYGPQMARRLEGLSPEERERALSELGDRAANELRRATGIRIPAQVIEPGTLAETVFKARRVRDVRGER